MQAKLKSVKTEMRKRMHDPIPEQGHWLAGVLQGHYNYYAVPGQRSRRSARSGRRSNGSGSTPCGVAASVIAYRALG